MNLKELCIIIQNMLLMNENEVKWDIRQMKWLSSSLLTSPMTTSGYHYLDNPWIPLCSIDNVSMNKCGIVNMMLQPLWLCGI